MILYPSVDELLERVDSRYSLIMLASKRAHELDAGAHPMLSEYSRVRLRLTLVSFFLNN